MFGGTLMIFCLVIMEWPTQDVRKVVFERLESFQFVSLRWGADMEDGIVGDNFVGGDQCLFLFCGAFQEVDLG